MNFIFVEFIPVYSLVNHSQSKPKALYSSIKQIKMKPNPINCLCIAVIANGDFL